MHSQIVVNPRFHGGTKIGKGDQFWQPKSVRGNGFGGGSNFSLQFHGTYIVVLEYMKYKSVKMSTPYKHTKCSYTLEAICD